MNQPHVPAPQNVNVLKLRLEKLAGQTLGSIAQEMGLEVPEDLSRNKGWQGQILEHYLGATASNQAKPDFENLGIELKTLPVGPDGEPKESTYVCTVPLENNHGIQWQDSWLYQKLSHVLWLPIEAEGHIPLAERTVGQGVLWQPSAEQFQALRQDWEELMEMVCLGQLEKITSHHGKYLQIRPKAANAKALCPATDEDGNRIMTLPRGFYLRTQFTRQIIRQYYAALA